MDGKVSSYLSSTEADVAVMLQRLGLPAVEALFEGIPESLRLQEDMNIPPALDEYRLDREMKRLASMNRSAGDRPCFLGAGAYDHFIPHAVKHLAGRSEFYTAYTPYQPEMSQGMLQAIFEYQSQITTLYGMDGANASLYDGATALAEAALMVLRATGRHRLLVSHGIHPMHRQVLAHVLRHLDVELVELPIDLKTGRLLPSALKNALDDDNASSDIAGVLMQSPNFLGVVEESEGIADAVHKVGALCVVSADPVSMGVLKSPGALGADICTGEGQPLGMPMSFGGPGLGLMAVKTPLLRQMPGRIVGQTRDIDGRRGFVLTLQAREQHIRRERAASNICTNQALCALTATIHLALLGPQGLQEVAKACVDNAVYLYRALLANGLAAPVVDAPFFREFAVWPVLAPEVMNGVLSRAGILGGLDLGNVLPECTREDGRSAWLLAVTEKRSREEMDRFIQVLCADPLIDAACKEYRKQPSDLLDGTLMTEGGTRV